MDFFIQKENMKNGARKFFQNHCQAEHFLMILDIRFYFDKNIIGLKYKVIMFGLEEKFPTIYKLTSLGLPKPY